MKPALGNRAIIRAVLLICHNLERQYSTVCTKTLSEEILPVLFSVRNQQRNSFRARYQMHASIITQNALGCGSIQFRNGAKMSINAPKF